MNLETFKQRVLKILPNTSPYAIQACHIWLVDYYTNYYPLPPMFFKPHHLVVEIVNEFERANEERRKEIRDTLRGNNK